MQLVVIAEPADRLLRLVERVAEESGIRQHVTQPLCGRLRVAQEPQVVAAGTEPFLEVAPAQQSHVGVLPFTEPAQHRGEQYAIDLRGTGDAGGERLHMPQRRLRVGETDGGVTIHHRLLAQFHAFVARDRADRQHRPVVDFVV